MPMTRNNFPNLLEEGLREVSFQAYKEKSQVAPKIFEVTTSKKHAEYDQSEAGLGMWDEKAEGANTAYEDMVEGYKTTYTHTTYSKGVRHSKELVDDDLYRIITRRQEALGHGARYRREYDAASLFNNANSTTVFTGGDAVALLSASHPRPDGGAVQSNTSASTALSIAALETALINMRAFKDENGLLIQITPRALLIPPALEFDAIEILRSSGKAYTANNDINSLAESSNGKLEIIVWDFLTASSSSNGPWFILAEKSDGAPIWFNREAVSFKADVDYDSDDVKAKGRMRYSFGFSDWRWVYGSMGS